MSSTHPLRPFIATVLKTVVFHQKWLSVGFPNNSAMSTCRRGAYCYRSRLASPACAGLSMIGPQWIVLALVHAVMSVAHRKMICYVLCRSSRAGRRWPCWAMRFKMGLAMKSGPSLNPSARLPEHQHGWGNEKFRPFWRQLTDSHMFPFDFVFSTAWILCVEARCTPNDRSA
jgi:hypothetical protein